MLNSRSTPGSYKSSADDETSLGRLVFGEAQPAEGQLAVAMTVVNRVDNHEFSYPNTVRGVACQKYGKHFEFNTMEESKHDTAWEKAKENKTAEYKNAMSAARSALSKSASDPTGGATAFCARDPCSATSDTKYAKAYNKTKIGNHYFVCQQPK